MNYLVLLDLLILLINNVMIVMIDNYVEVNDY